MTSPLLFENEKKRRQIPLRLLLCFVMFCVWQMGIIYYIGPALNIDGRTPLPIPEDNLTVLIVAGYVCSILVMILFPRATVWMCRISTGAALVSAAGLFFPLGTQILQVLICLQCFCCCFMIGFESATMVHYMSQDSVVQHLLIAYPIGYTLIAFVQSDFIPMDFSVFRILMLLMLALLLLFYIRLPSGGCIRFVKKADKLVIPKRFLTGFLLLAFLAALLGVIAPAAAAEVEHGVFAAYLSCAAASALIYLLYKKTGRHPICFVSYIIGISAIGYVLLVVSEHISALGLVASVMIGTGMSACALLPLFSLLLVKQYPSKFIVPGYIALAMLAVIVQSVLVEVFRDSTVLLNLAYLVVVIVLAILFVSMEPYLIFSVQRKFQEQPGDLKQTQKSGSTASDSISLNVLTKREAEIVNLIRYGHSNADIGKLLFISEHTVKDHTKNIYRKLNVHSRYELTALVNHLKTEVI